MSNEDRFYFNAKKDISPVEREFVPITGLYPISSEELIFGGELDEDRVCTDLSLRDYGWAYYSLATKLRTEKNGLIRIQWDHSLFSFSWMYVTQLKDHSLTYYYIEYDSTILEEAFKAFMTEHMKQWESDSNHFNGEAIVIKLFNDVLKTGNLCGRATTSHNVPYNLSWDVEHDEIFRISDIIEKLNGKDE